MTAVGTDAWLTFGSMAIELGTPVGMAVAWSSRGSLRPRLAVVFGALTPLLALDAWVLLGWVVGPDDSTRWSIGAVWVMTLGPYLLCLALGAALAHVRRPRHLLARYLLGLAVPAAAGLILAV